jgi:hypothetical protein
MVATKNEADTPKMVTDTLKTAAGTKNDDDTLKTVTDTV